MKHPYRSFIMTITWIAGACIVTVVKTAEPPPAKSSTPMPTEIRVAIDDAALARRIEEYSDTKKGAERAAEDHLARTVVKRFIPALVGNDLRAMLTETSLPWLDRAELARDEKAAKRCLAEYRLPSAFGKGEPRITLLTGLEELEQSLGKQVPDSARKVWADHLTAGSRIAVVEGGPMLLGLAMRRTKPEYSVSGLLFDYFPKPDDPLLRAITKDSLDK